MAAANRKMLLQQQLKMILLMLIRLRRKRKNKRDRKKIWIRKLFQEREEKSEFYKLVKDMQLFDSFYFFKCFRMSPSMFEKLLSWIGPTIQKCSLRRPTATPSERLCVTLRYICTGDAQTTIATSYRISPPVVGRIINETCGAIWNILNKRFIDPPSTKEDWSKIAQDFENKWNFPNCLAAIDGKHIMIQAPPRTGSEYFNYKKLFSVVLLACCDANYKFTLVDIGDNGRQSDGGVYTNSKLGFAIDNNLLNFPTSRKIGTSSKVMPYVFVADDAFSMKPHLLKPYPGSNLDLSKCVYNYRLSRARRVIENSFGILASRFRIFRRAIIANVNTVINICESHLNSPQYAHD